MDFKNIGKILGVLLVLFSTTHLPPAIVGLIYNDQNVDTFLLSFFATFMLGLACWLPAKSYHQELRYRDGFLVVVLFWAVLGTFGSLPFLISPDVHMSISNAVFESMSGLTTTGATVFDNLDYLPKSILYYRQQLQWLGGMGIVVLAVAIMPMLGVGGMSLFRAETPGPMKDSKLKPRVTETAKSLWLVYFGLTVACSLGYFLAGMSIFDAITHSFSTVAIGGFSTHDQSIAYFNSGLIEGVAMFFMLLAAANFSLHFYAFRSFSLKRYFSDSEYRVFLVLVFIVGTLVSALLIIADTFPAVTAIRQGFFHVVSVFTTTGFTSAGFAWWPGVIPVLLIAISFIGGCAGSTAGGIKVMRVQLLYKQGKQEIVQLVHPNALMSIKLGDQVINAKVMSSVWAFFSLYILSFALIGLALSATGLDWITAFSSAAACLNNLGPALGEAASNYSELNATAKWILSFAMLLGRLELFTLLVLFTATFWRN